MHYTRTGAAFAALLCLCLNTITAFVVPVPSCSTTRQHGGRMMMIQQQQQIIRRSAVIMMAAGDEDDSMIGPSIGPAGPPAPAAAPAEPEVPLTPEEQAMKEKKEKIEALRAKEVFESTETGDYECQICGWKYLEEKGFGPYKPGTSFAAVSADFKCPNCKANKSAFKPIMKTIAGFSDNRQYGFGGNNLTSEQKGGLIFGSLFFFFGLFLAGYLLE